MTQFPSRCCEVARSISSCNPLKTTIESEDVSYRKEHPRIFLGECDVGALQKIQNMCGL
jgi:hypothetical protein